MQTDYSVELGREDETLAFPFERFMAAITEKTKLIIMGSDRNWAFKVATVPNLMILLTLIRQRQAVEWQRSQERVADISQASVLERNLS